MMYGLDLDFFLKLKQVFEKNNQIEKVILYGSRTIGNYRNGSDIDITILGNDFEFSSLLKLQEELEELNSPYTFDVSIFSNIKNQNLKHHIKRVGVEIYKNK